MQFCTYVHAGSNSVQDSRDSSHSSSRCVDSTGTSISRSEGAATGSPKLPVKPIASLYGNIKGDCIVFHATFMISFLSAAAAALMLMWTNVTCVSIQMKQ